MVQGVTAPVILGFDTSGHHCAVALTWGDGQVAHVQEDMAKGQVERLMPLIQELMDQEGFEFSDLDAVAVGIGPGNFTGIRIAVSAARGLALGLGVPAIAVSSFELMRGPNSMSDHRAQIVSLSAPRDTQYLQLFQNGLAVDGAIHLDRGAGGNIAATMPAVEIIGENADLLFWAHFAPENYDGPVAAFDRSIQDIPLTLVRIAAQKFTAGVDDMPSPAPLYVKAADAAPPRDAPPVILP